MRHVAIAALLLSTTAIAEPQPYTVDSKTGLRPSIQSSVFTAVRRVVAPLKEALNLTRAEEECAQATLGEAFVRATADALRDTALPLLGESAALDFFSRSQDDWCNKEGGRRGAVAVATAATRAKSVVRPFLVEEMRKHIGHEPTPAEVAALVAAIILASPALVPASL